MPFVGTEHDDVVPLGDVGEETVGGHHRTESRVTTDDGEQFGDTIVDGGESGIILAQRVRRDGEIELVQLELLERDLCQMDVGDGGRIE